MFESVATALEPLLVELVFVGGATLPFYVWQGFQQDIRVTADVDCIVPAATLLEFHRFEEILQNMGHKPSTEEGDPICRYVVGGHKVDFMPYAEVALGFTNRWYRPGMQAAMQRQLPSGRLVKLMPRAYFIGAKLEAHRSRGGNDLRLSQDFEDVLRALDFPTAIGELSAAPEDLRAYLKATLKELVADRLFDEALESALGRGRQAAAKGLDTQLKAWLA